MHGTRVTVPIFYVLINQGWSVKNQLQLLYFISYNHDMPLSPKSKELWGVDVSSILKFLVQWGPILGTLPDNR